MDSLTRAATYYQQLAHTASNVDDLLTYLGEAIESARVALEECLRGYDSFDTLAFLRFAAAPRDFSEVRESESRVETSQAARDVIALTLLGMGLPRQPLTGENSGQPDAKKALGRAAEIVKAAGTRAVVQGQRIDQPLGALSGEFMGYELSVRGRQHRLDGSAKMKPSCHADEVTEHIVAPVGDAERLALRQLGGEPVSDRVDPLSLEDGLIGFPGLVPSVVSIEQGAVGGDLCLILPPGLQAERR